MGNKRYSFTGIKRPSDNAEWHKAAGRAMYEWRIKRGLSQQNLADKTSATRGQVSKYELGNASPKAEHLVEIAQALQITIQDLQPDMITTCKLDKQESFNLLLRKTEAVISDMREIQRLARTVFVDERYSGHLQVIDRFHPDYTTPEELRRARGEDSE